MNQTHTTNDYNPQILSYNLNSNTSKISTFVLKVTTRHNSIDLKRAKRKKFSLLNEKLLSSNTKTSQLHTITWIIIIPLKILRNKRQTNR